MSHPYDVHDRYEPSDPADDDDRPSRHECDHDDDALTPGAGQHVESVYCGQCSGSGEGQYDGTTCRTCHGHGEVMIVVDDVTCRECGEPCPVDDDGVAGDCMCEPEMAVAS